jgi:hypothetical protein
MVVNRQPDRVAPRLLERSKVLVPNGVPATHAVARLQHTALGIDKRADLLAILESSRRVREDEKIPTQLFEKMLTAVADVHANTVTTHVQSVHLLRREPIGF